ncbi:AAA family ATPase [Mycobacterium seoulense]|uniref:AAA family ATPase n=1 Tax=Mycobacterium seoulense TaxID=386911 RepID=UPI003CE78692
MKSSDKPGSRAAVGAAEATTNGHAAAQADKTGANERPPSPFDKRPTKLTEDAQFGSPETATTAPGVYVAAHAKITLPQGGRNAVAELGSVLLSNARSIGLIDHSPAQADVARWHAEHGQEWGPWEPETPATVDLAGLKAASKGLQGDRKIALTTVGALADAGRPWAKRAVARAEIVNLDATVPWKDKLVAFTIADLYGNYKAPVDDLAALSPMDDEARRDSWRLLRVWAAMENQRAQATARTRLAEADAAEITLPPVRSLDALLAEDDDPVRMRIAEVWPSGGAKVLCAAPAGAGKTTLSGNLIRSLADGDPFLGVFEVHQRAERIVVIDNEMTDSMLRRWLRRQGVRNTAAVVDVVCLRGQGHLFDLGNDRVRDMWARRWADLGADFVIFDCVKPALEAMGLDENREMGKLLYPLTDTLTAAGVDDVLVHHHMGHQHERARGDSSALGWSDGNWKIVWEGDQNSRYFATAKVRDAEKLVPEGLLSWDSATNRLTYAGGNRAATATSETLEARISEVRAVLVDRHAEGITDDKGLTKTDLKNAVGGNKKITAQAIDLAAKRQLALVTRGRGEARWYRIAPRALDPAYTGEDGDDDQGTLPGGEPGGGAVAVVWPGAAGGAGPTP